MRFADGDQDIARCYIRRRREIEFERGHATRASTVRGEQTFSGADPRSKRFVSHDHIAFRSSNGLSWFTFIPLSPL